MSINAKPASDCTVQDLVSNIKMGDLPYSKTDCVADLDKPRPIKPRKPAKLPPSVPARACNLSKTCALRKAGKCTPVHCADAYHFVANAPADLPATAGKVRRDVRCPRCGSASQVWENQITGVLMCHRLGCHISVPNAPADLPATAGKVRRDVGQSGSGGF